MGYLLETFREIKCTGIFMFVLRLERERNNFHEKSIKAFVLFQNFRILSLQLLQQTKNI